MRSQDVYPEILCGSTLSTQQMFYFFSYFSHRIFLTVLYWPQSKEHCCLHDSVFWVYAWCCFCCFSISIPAINLYKLWAERPLSLSYENTGERLIVYNSDNSVKSEEPFWVFIGLLVLGDTGAGGIDLFHQNFIDSLSYVTCYGLLPWPCYSKTYLSSEYSAKDQPSLVEVWVIMTI